MRREGAIALGETSLAAALWGTSFPVISVALREGLEPTTFLFLRFALASPLVLVLALTMRKDLRRHFMDRGVWVVALLNAVGFFCQFVGQVRTSASVAALLVNLSVVLAAVGSAVFLKERLGAYKVSGVVLAFAGTALIATNGDLGSVTGGELLGDALYITAAVSWAGYIVYAKGRTDAAGWDPVAVSACIVSLTALFALPPALLFWGAGSMTPLSWEAIVYTAVFNSAIPFVLYQSGLRWLTATSSAIVLMLEVVVAVLISVVALGEAFSFFSAVGAAAVLSSILLVSGVEVRGKSLSVAESGASRVKGSP